MTFKWNNNKNKKEKMPLNKCYANYLKREKICL